MILCTECYLQKNDQTLMLYRNKKKNDINEGKYIGLGGRFEFGESPEECVIREVKEEAGVTLKSFRFRGTVTFLSHEKGDPIYIFFFTADQFDGEIKDCDEGELCWVETDKIAALNLWAGDHLIWEWLKADKGIFSAKLIYDGDNLMEHHVRFY
ncbi:MAG: 8-oxo-dGTP diphosphatase [Lachnospiraceae bacterium]|nr:8-oxo-dGTP diphosphatase [Lachnospiraceae bacterium]